jgi:hypothetical protein
MFDLDLSGTSVEALSAPPPVVASERVLEDHDDLDDLGEGLDPAVLAEALAEASPGPHLLPWLVLLDPTRHAPEVRVNLLIAFEKAAAWLAAGQARVLASLDQTDEDWTREEVACALRISGNAAGHRLEVARDLVGRLPGTLEALATGRISLPHAAVMSELTGRLDAEQAAAVEARVLPRAGRYTPSELRRATRRAALAACPEPAQAAHERAVRGRSVQLWPAEDGMAELHAFLPAEGALTVMAALTALANRKDGFAPAFAGGPGACGVVGCGTQNCDAHRPGIDARRADALMALAHAALQDPNLPRQQGVRPHIQVTVADTTLLGLDDAPGELEGYGPITAATARRIAAHGTWRRLMTDPVTGVVTDVSRRTYTPNAALTRLIVARDRTCQFPHCLMPARRCDIDHAIAFDDGGPTDPCNCHALCRRHHRAKHEAGWRVTRHPDDSAIWTSPAGKIYRTRPPTHGP